MKSWKAHIAVLFLAILSVSVVPRSLWHECDHGHSENLAGKSSAVQVDVDCLICDYNFSAADLEAELVVSENIQPPADFVAFPAKSIFVFPPDSQPLRGPPHC